MDVQEIPAKIERIKTGIEALFGKDEAEVTIDWPESPRGNHFIDVRAHDKHVVIEWRPDQQVGYGITKLANESAASYGQKPDAIIPEVDEILFLRVKELLE